MYKYLKNLYHFDNYDGYPVERFGRRRQQIGNADSITFWLVLEY